MNPGGLITGWNEGASLLFGWEAGEALGRDSHMIFTPEYRAADTPERELEAVLIDGQAESERWHQHKDGSCFWGSGLMSPLRAGGEMPGGFLKILRDRTEDMQARRDQRRRLD